MKKINISPILFSVLLMCACAEEAPLDESRLSTAIPPPLTELDQWLRDTFTKPYNIEMNYRWNENEVDLERFLFPPTPSKVKLALELVRAIWIDPYSKVRPDIIHKIAPRIFFLVGGKNINLSGKTRMLGSAEGGKKVVLYEVDLLDAKDAVAVRRFLSTIQHEYAHILNQTIPFDETAYEKVALSISEYGAQWFNLSVSQARSKGFISPYASSKVTEDFAEMVNAMLSNTKEDFDAIIDDLSDDDAKTTLRQKEAIVVEYYKSGFGIDIYELQRETAAATERVTQ